MTANSFGSTSTLRVGEAGYQIHRLDAVDGSADLPFSLKILLENLLRTEDGRNITAEHVSALAQWDPAADPSIEIQFTPARVLLQDLTGVPAVVDLATMREAMRDLGGDPGKINPLVPAELVIDHSVVADIFGRPDAFDRNVELEFGRNRERFQFLRWGQDGFSQFKVVPPGTGIVHQVNIEHLARVVMSRDGAAYPDTCVGTDSHTTMQNGLGVLGWGVGGIEAEAAMLGQPISMLIPRVVGFRLTGELPAGTTATDLVLTITELLRRHGVVGKFVEFYGEGVGAVPLANRATIGNMSPEFGSTCAIFPIDQQTLSYLELTGRPAEQVALVEAYAKEQGLWHDPAAEPRYSEQLKLDLSTIVPSLAGPKRPQDRVALSDAKESFREALGNYVQLDRLDEDLDDTFPASDPFTADRENGDADQPAGRPVASGTGRPSHPAQVTLEDGRQTSVDHGSVVIAAITSCTNTSNPSVMVGAALLAKKAVEAGLATKPWVKTTLAPGSKVVMDYYERAGLVPYLDKLGFNLVGYGCTTCIGNSGPLPEAISAGVTEADLAVVSVLSGNRNFEGRINPDVKMNYLASPPLVVAYALAGTMDFDMENEPLGSRLRRHPGVPARHLAVRGRDRRRGAARGRGGDVHPGLRGRVRGRRPLAGAGRARRGHVRLGRRLHLRAQAPVLRRHAGQARAGHRHPRRPGAGPAGRLGDHRPHLAGRRDQDRQPGREVPDRARRGAEGLQLLRLAARQPRGDDPRHVRQHPAAQPARPRHRGRRHRAPARRRADVHLRRLPEVRRGGRPAGRAGRQGVRLRVVAGLGGQGHRAARGAGRAGRVVRADPPLQPDRHGRAAAAVPPGESAESLGLTGQEVFEITGIEEMNSGAVPREVTVRADGTQFRAVVRIDTPGEAEYFRHGGIMQYVLRSLLG